MVAYIELTRDDDKRVGEGPEPSPAPRFGCTDPFAKNWDSQAEMYGQAGPATSLHNAINGQVCTYAERFGQTHPLMQLIPDSQAWMFTDWVRGGGSFNDMAFRDTFMGNVCYDDSSDEVVIRHWDANRDNPKAKSPLMACHDGEIMLGVIEQQHLVLDEREGVFEETSYSTGNWAGLGVSVMVPPDGARFDRTYYFENMYDETNPPGYPAAGQITEYSLQYHSGSNPIGPLAAQVTRTNNKRTMRLRGEAASQLDQNKDYKDNMYGRLWRVGDPRVGTLGDLDFDKDGRIGSGFTNAASHENALQWLLLLNLNTYNPSGLQNQTGVYGYDGQEEGLTLTYTNPEVLEEYGIDEWLTLQMSDLDKDGRLSFWELAHVVLGHSSSRVWFPERYGLLGYDGVACGDRPEHDLSEVACFPFSEQSMDELESKRDDLFKEWDWYAANTNEVQIDRSFMTDISTCLYYEEWPENFDEVQFLMLQQGQTYGAWQDSSMTEMGYDFCIKLKAQEYGFDPKNIYNALHGDRPYTRRLGDEVDLSPGGSPGLLSPFHGGDWPENPCYSQTRFYTLECERVYVDIPEDSDVPVKGRIEATAPESINILNPGEGLEFLYGGHPFFETFEGENYNYPHDYNEDSGDLVLARKSCPASHPYFVRFCSVGDTSDNLVGETIDIAYSEETENENS